jgi:hypothetical protein
LQQLDKSFHLDFWKTNLRLLNEFDGKVSSGPNDISSNNISSMDISFDNISSMDISFDNISSMDISFNNTSTNYILSNNI